MNLIRRKTVAAFTLMESLLAALVLAMTVTAIIMPFTTAARNEQCDGRRTLAVSLAQEMMEEVLSKPFDDPQGPGEVGPEADETGRGSFDNIDDFDGYNESAGNVSDLSGVASTAPEAVGLSRHVTASYMYLPGQDVAGVPTSVSVTVEVRHDNQPLLALSRLACAP